MALGRAARRWAVLGRSRRRLGEQRGHRCLQVLGFHWATRALWSAPKVCLRETRQEPEKAERGQEGEREQGLVMDEEKGWVRKEGAS